jgi:IMP dehydrogenase
MGSVGAMARGSADRYFQAEVSDTHKLVPEGIEGARIGDADELRLLLHLGDRRGADIAHGGAQAAREHYPGRV